MPATITSHLAIAAIRLKQQYPQLPARELLDACLRDRIGALEDFGRDLEPGHPFASLLVEAFGFGLGEDDLATMNSRTACPRRVAELRMLWRSEVLARFAATYGLAI